MVQDDSAVRYGFAVAGWSLLIPRAAFSEVLRPRKLQALPHGSPLFPGLIERRGRLVPVFDLRPLCGSGSAVASPDSACLLLLGRGPEGFALSIDDLPAPLNDPQPTAVPESLPDILHACVEAALAAGDRDWLEIDPLELCRRLQRIASASHSTVYGS